MRRGPEEIGRFAWAITMLLLEQLEEMALDWPKPPYDVERERRRLLAIP